MSDFTQILPPIDLYLSIPSSVALITFERTGETEMSKIDSILYVFALLLNPLFLFSLRPLPYFSISSPPLFFYLPRSFSFICFRIIPPIYLQRGTADTEIQVRSPKNPVLSKNLSDAALGRSEYSLACFSCRQEIYFTYFYLPSSFKYDQGH